ncbi:hypothetical protein ACLOJK_020401 [Asimina triloba]
MDKRIFTPPLSSPCLPEIHLPSVIMAATSTIQKFLPVPSVQELARQRLGEVPSHYIRDGVDDPARNPSDPTLQIPVLDMAQLLDPDSHEKELLKLTAICRDWGAFQVVNHGIGSELVQSMRDKCQGFFNLQLEERKQYAQKEGSVEGYGQAFVTSEEQRLEWSDMLFIHALPLKDRNYSFWPQEPQGFRETLDCYSGEIKRLALSLLGFMAKGLGLESHEFSADFEDGLYHVRMNYYPHCCRPQQVIGMEAHRDITGITLLLESDGTQGLQIRKDGCWVPVKMVSGALLVVIGNIGEVNKDGLYGATWIMSNGIYRSPEHRVVVNSLKERQTIVTFCYPNENAIIRPAPHLVNPQNPALYKTLSHADYFKRYFTQRNHYESLIDTLKIDSSS